MTDEELVVALRERAKSLLELRHHWATGVAFQLEDAANSLENYNIAGSPR